MGANKSFLKIKRDTLAKIFSVEKSGDEKEDIIKDLDYIYKKASGSVNVLFIAESPGGSSSYFYDLEGNEKFRCKILSPLIGKENYSKKGTKETIELFIKQKGFWLTDLFYRPVDDIFSSHIEKEINTSKEFLRNEINGLNPSKIVFILPKGGFGSDSSKYTVLKNYFAEVFENDKNQFISTQKEILHNLDDTINLDITFDYDVGPFPNPLNSIANEWYEYEEGYCSFSDWVNKNREWLEIDGE